MPDNTIMPKKDHIILGFDFASISNISTSICAANEAGYNRYYIPIAHPRYKREFVDETIIQSHGDNYSRTIIAVYSQEYIGCITGKLSDHVNADSSDEDFRKFSETILEQELKWCQYLGLQTVMVTLPMHGPFVNLARLVYAKIKQSANSPNFLIRVPMVSPACAKAEFLGTEIPNNDAWHRWNNFRTFCSSEKKLKVALELADNLPDEEEIERWFGEPIGCIILNAKTFITNQAGFPVLSKAHQIVVSKFLARKTQFVITGTASEDMKPLFTQYLVHLNTKSEENDAFSEYINGYEDFLQIPLQPLMDNLDQYTYEIFERDPVKYREYQRAIKLALLDKKAAAASSQIDTPIVVMVVGAGRGPIVNAALNAAEEADANVKLYAIEKNPNAIVSLQSQKLDRWKDRVTIVATDMRKWKATEKADIMVSELLGSFGDNELSPECLDGAQSFLKEDGISIPSSYSSYICPTQTHKIYAEISDFVDREKPAYQRFEQPYVVHLQTVYHIADIQKLFTFDHPNRSELIDNSRFRKLTFEAKQDCVVHGFSGYFDTVLYKDVILSIVPETFSEGMFSWFPIFFPVKEPVQMKKGETCEISVWRLKNEKIVWYEWLISAPLMGPVHNPNGRSYFIGLT